jgi:hypothetical protein
MLTSEAPVLGDAWRAVYQHSCNVVMYCSSENGCITATICMLQNLSAEIDFIHIDMRFILAVKFAVPSFVGMRKG